MSLGKYSVEQVRCAQLIRSSSGTIEEFRDFLSELSFPFAPGMPPSVLVKIQSPFLSVYLKLWRLIRGRGTPSRITAEEVVIRFTRETMICSMMAK
jgi:hypothetical protein